MTCAAPAWFRAPAATRWRWLNWPGWARLVATLSFLAQLNWMLLAPSDVFDATPELLPHQDKIAHLGLFLVLALLVRWSLPARFPERSSSLIVLVLLVLYAGSIEVLQPLLSSSRTFDWLDMAGNFTGVCGGWVLYGRCMGGPLRETRPLPETG